MNQNITNLCSIAAKETRYIIGLMSGTSLDGLDIALCCIKGSGLETEIELVQFETIAYNSHFKDEIRGIFSKHTVDLEKICLLNGWVAKQHANMILNCLENWQIKASQIDLIASHGQTIYHSPKFLHPHDEFGNGTLQIGDGDHLAVTTGIITISDFRQKHIATGGEGAPLAVYGDYFIFSKKDENRIMLNIGGIANFTYLPGNLDSNEIFSTDTGPGNTIMDAYAQKHFQLDYDKDSALAQMGNVNEGFLHQLENHLFFDSGFPKTTGPELFNLKYIENALLQSGIDSLPHFDVMASLNQFSANTIVKAIKRTVNSKESVSIYVSGGGMHNPQLMQQLKSLLPAYSFYSTESLNINPDAKEAVLFAILANETVAGGFTQFGKEGKGIPSISMGKISFPN